MNPVVFNVPESFTLGDEVELSVENISGDVSVSYVMNNQQVGTGESTTLKPVFTGNQNITARITAHGTTTGITKTITGNAPKMTLEVDPKSFTIGENVVLSVSGVPEGIEGITVKFYNGSQLLQEGTSTSCTLTQPTQTGDIRVKAEVYLKGAYGDTKILDEESTITGNLPTMSLTATPSYTVGSDDVTMSVTGVPSGATVKFYFNGGQVYSGSETSYTYEKPRLVGGSIPVKAEVYLNGTNLWNTTVYVTGKMPDITFTATPDPYKVGKDNVTLEVTGAPEGSTIKFYFNGTEVYGEGNSRIIEKPSQMGNVNVKATVDLDNNNSPEWTSDDQLTITGEFPEMSIAVSPEECVVDNQITLSVPDAPQNSYYNYEVKGPENESFSGQNPNYTFTPTKVGTYNVKVTLTYNNVNYNQSSKVLETVIEVKNVEDNSGSTDETTGENANSGENNANVASIATFSIRKGLNRLVAEGEQEAYTISAPAEKSIKGLKLKAAENYNTDYSFKVSLYNVDTLESEKNYTKDSQGNYNIEIPSDKEITKVVIEIISGAMKLENYEVTYKEPCKRVTKSAPFEFTADANDKSFDIFYKDDNSYDIILTEEWMQHLDGFTLNLSADSSNQIYYKLYTLENGEYKEDLSSNASFSGRVLTVKELNKRNIAKINIKSNDGSLLPIESYSINALTDEETDVTTPNNIKIIEHKYTIEELEAPNGFFTNTDEKYEVTVTEEFDLVNEVYANHFPTVIDTKILVKKLEKNDDGEFVERDKVYETNLRISYGLDGTELNRNIRIIEVMDGDNVLEKFELTMEADTDTNKQKVTSITYNKNTTITVPTEAGIFKIDDKSYYYNPETIMIVPMPEKNIKIENTPGLLFKKIDDRGDRVTGVEITLTPATNSKGESLWSWNAETSEQLIDVSKLDAGTLYCFSETDTGGKYHKADDIFFKYQDSKIYYGTSADQLVNELDLINNRVIEMVDNRIVGTKLTLEKVDEEGVLLGEEGNYAVFDLYAENGTLIKSGIEVKNDNAEIEFGNDAPKEYVENGYLKPGNYYLIETKIPEHSDPNKWYKNPGKIKFRIYYDEAAKQFKNEMLEEDDDNTGGSGNTGGSDDGDNALSVVNRSDKHIADVFMSNGEQLNISNVTGIEIVVESWNESPKLQIYITGLDITSGYDKTSGSANNSSYFKYSNNNLNISTLNKVEIQNWTDDKAVVRYVKITTSDSEYVFVDPLYTPASAASLDDDLAVIDETGESTDENSGTESGEETGTGSDENTDIESDGDTGDGTDEDLGNEPLEEPTKVKFTITNVVDDNEREVKVEKKWTDDTGFEEFRPRVTITLYQSKTKIDNFADYIKTATDEQKATLQPKDKNGEVVTNVTLTLDNGEVTGKFTGLPTKYKDTDNTYKDYHYYIIETPVEGYETVGYTQTDDGILVVENKLETVSVSAEKIWSGDDTKPASITVQLQVEVNGKWENVEGKKLSLTADSNWTGQFTDLAPGKNYRLSETAVYGWEVDSASTLVVNGVDGEKLTITNKPAKRETGNLSISKIWKDAQDLPESVYVQLYRKIKKLWPEGQPMLSVYDDDGNITTVGVVDDYARLLQYSLYFYDANMCGDDVSESSAYSWRNNCHTDDEIVGGYHDAGDHAVFGLPQGYSASMLGWNFYEFNTSVDDPDMKVYDKLGQTNHIKLILDRFCDYFVESVKYENGDKNNQISAILVQKGAGNPDHQYWGAPELQETRMDSVTLKDDGRGNTGWTNGERTLDNEMFWVSNSGADIASEYAAALALQYLNFRSEASTQEEIEKYENYLTVAKKLYQFALAHPTAYNEWGVNKDETATHKDHPGFYASESCDDDIALAAAWLYLATKEAGSADSSYLSKVKNSNSSWAFSWNDVNLAAACANAHITQNWDTVKGYVSNYANKGESYYSQDGWGSARYNAIAQFATLAVAKNIAAKDSANAEYYSNWAKSQMTILLGNNNWGENNSSVCLITGFTENSTKNAHHRAASGWDSLAEYKVNATYDIDSHKLLGALVGGPSGGPHNEEQMINYGHTNLTSDEHGDYVDDLHDYCCNEVSLDYQAGLVGAAAGLYYFYETGELYEIPGVKTQYLPTEETPVAQEEETPAPQQAEQPQDTNSTANNENEAAQQSSTGTETNTSEAGAQVARLSSRFSNTFSLLSAGFSRLASEGTSVSNTYEMSNVEFDKTYDISLEDVTSITFEFTAQQINFNFSLETNDGFKMNGAYAGYAYNTFTHTESFNPPIDFNWFRLTSGNVPDDLNLTMTITHGGANPPSASGISITNTETTLTEGDTLNLTYSGAAEGSTVTWSLPDGTNAAEIINGNALKANNVDSDTVVEVTVSDTETSDTEEFTIKPLEFVDTKTTMNLKENSSQTLKLNSTRNLSEFNWNSSDTSIIEVNNGVATAMGAGTATITATDKNNSVIFATIEIEVKDVQPLTVGVSTNDIVINGTATLTPSDNVTYSGYDGNIIQIDGNTITGKQKGSTTITAKTSDGREAQITINVLEMSIIVPKTAIKVNEEITLTINNPPYNATFEWYSNNSGIISVNNGTIKGVSAGTTQVYVVAKVNGNEVARATSEIITVNQSDTPTEVTTPEGYVLVHTENINELYADKTIYSSTPAKLKGITVDYIIVEFSSNSNETYNGAFYINGTEESFTTDSYDNQKKYKVQNNILSIPIQNGVNIDTLSVKCWWNGNNGNVARLENIYFYRLKADPSISGIPDEFRVGDEPITLTAKDFDGPVTWSIVSGSDCAEIDPNTGVLTAKGAGTVTVNAVYGDQEATADVTIGAYQLKYESGETDHKTFSVHVDDTPNSIKIDLPSGVIFSLDSVGIATIEEDYTITGLSTGSVGFTASLNGDTIRGTIQVLDEMTITAPNNIVLTSETLQFTAVNNVGTVQWSVDNSEYATIGEDGILRPKKAGTVTVKATDADGTTATLESITIQLGSAKVDTSGMEKVGERIEITSTGNWETIVVDLPITDANGDYYCYYIVECDKDGNIIENTNPVHGQSGSKYIPTEYVNGELLTNDGNTQLSVENTWSGKTQGQMPSSGGVGRSTYYFFGGMIMLLSAAGYTCTRRRQRSRREE